MADVRRVDEGRKVLIDVQVLKTHERSNRWRNSAIQAVVVQRPSWRHAQLSQRLRVGNTMGINPIVQSIQSNHLTYKYCRFTRDSIEEGMVPLSRLALKSL